MNFGNPLNAMPPQTRRAIAAIVLFLLGAILLLAAVDKAGMGGEFLYLRFTDFLGVGYFMLPLLSFLLAYVLIRNKEAPFPVLKAVSSAIFFIAGLGFIELVSQDGGVLGSMIENPIVSTFDIWGGGLLLGAVVLISFVIAFEVGIPNPMGWLGKAKMPALPNPFNKKAEGDDVEHAVQSAAAEIEGDETPKEALKPRVAAAIPEVVAPEAPRPKLSLEDYHAPPISLLERDKGKPGVGDIKANANLIKRTLQNFGIVVELDEISIGPSVTRYAIKPAEGVRLSKIVSLQTNLELALAAHPVRIEAPIPGKSLVGIEVPNTSKVTVGLGNLFSSEEFEKSNKPLLVGLGRDITGVSHFANFAKMPHMLIAGATGSGKSVTIHTLINSLLYRNGPQTLRFLMIDPKRVELTLYNRIPHLLSPVITDAKKAIMALRWAAKEMDRRYNVLEQETVRDISSYHENVLAPALQKLRAKGGVVAEGEQPPEAMPYIVIIIDELADIMQAYPRELEAAIVRLAQMSRAVGIHLMLSTQRPSVNVITGLIKANVPSRIALQVASQIDSRTILDGSGAEKLLGAGDMLFLSGDMGKPIRLQSAYIGENEVKKVVDYIAKNNPAELPVIDLGAANQSGGGGSENSAMLSQSLDGEEEIDDALYEAAKSEVLAAGKASTSYLQRKLRVGYSRAARIIDVLEERGVIGPADGAKPREVIGGSPSQSDEGQV